MEQTGTCTKCGNILGRTDAQVCSRCGWDSQIGMRKCVKCKMAVVLNEKIGFGPIGGLVGIGGFVFWRLFGLLLGGAIVSAIGASCGAITALTLEYCCSDCGKVPEARLLDADEKEIRRKRKLGFTLAAAGLGVLAVLLFIGWLALWRSALSGR
jgi:hypothetical protein